MGYVSCLFKLDANCVMLKNDDLISLLFPGERFCYLFIFILTICSITLFQLHLFPVHCTADQPPKLYNKN